MIVTKHQPATPLPWTQDGDHITSADKGTSIALLSIRSGSIEGHYPVWFDAGKNAEYLLHATKHYPRLIDALRQIREAPLRASSRIALEALCDVGEAL